MKNKTTTLTLLLATLLTLLTVPAVQAIDVAPRISDREIVEKLAGLEAGQKALSARIDDVNKRIDDLRSEMKAGQEALRNEMKAGQEAINTRISSLEQTMLALFGALIALIVALMGYLAWDRRTMIKPVIERIENLEQKGVGKLDLRHVD